MRTLALTPVAILALLLGVVSAPRAADPDPADEEAKFLRANKVATDGPALLSFFRERTISGEQKATLDGLIRKLGDDAFAVREKAGEDLVKKGRLAVPFLKAALADGDAEVTRRAEDALRQIEQGTDLTLASAAARVIAAKKPDGAVEVLLAYLTSAGDEGIEEAVAAAIGAVGLRDGKAHPALETALKDKEVLRRAAAAAVVGRGTAEQRKAVAPLLQDKEARVRFSAGIALVRGGDKAGVPALIDLLETGPPSLSAQAEDVLFVIAGPDAKLPAMGPDDRKKCRQEWEAWWKKNGEKASLAKIDFDEPQLGITLVCDVNGSNAGGGGDGRVWEVGRDGKTTWEMTGVAAPIDAHRLPGGRYLIAEHQGARVTERDRNGKVLWEHKTPTNPVSCQRLANGNVFIATYSGHIIEVTREGKELYNHKPGNTIFGAIKLRSGNILYASNNNEVVEMDVSGKKVKTIAVNGTGSWAGAELLPNGNYLVGVYAVGKVFEIDAAGKVRSEANVQSATYPTRLRNGNTLVPSPDAYKVVELDRNGKEIWSAKSKDGFRPFRARRY